MDTEKLFQNVARDQIHIAERLASARQLGEASAAQFDRLVKLASDAALPGEVSRELGRSIALMALKFDRTGEVDNNLLRDFTEHAYEGYDVEVAIARWSRAQR